MARVIKFQRNPWGTQAALGGEEPQRSDLWVVDLTSVLRGISTQLHVDLSDIPAYFAQSVSIPELRVKGEPFRRDSRPYNMPIWDDACDMAKITFILDAPSSGSSRIYSVLDLWRSLVRAGRGSMSKESVPVLNSNYRIDFQFNINVLLLKGGTAAIQTAQQPTDIAVINQAMSVLSPRAQEIFMLQRDNTNTAQMRAPLTASEQADQAAEAQRQASAAAASTALLISNSTQLATVDNDLQYSGAYTLQNAWLSGFRISDMSYNNNTQISTIEALFYVEDVFDQNRKV